MAKVIKSSPKILVVAISLLAAHVYSQDNEASSMQNLPRTAAQWQALTEQDIQYAYAQTAANHPGTDESPRNELKKMSKGDRPS